MVYYQFPVLVKDKCRHNLYIFFLCYGLEKEMLSYSGKETLYEIVSLSDM